MVGYIGYSDNMAEEVIIQTADEVSVVDYKRNINDAIDSQAEEIQNNMDTIAEQLDTIIDNTNNNSINGTPIQTDVDLSEVTDLIENIDTTLVEANTQDILVQLNNQQEQIDDINQKLDLILNKL